MPWGPTVQWNILNYGQITNNVRVQDARFQELLIDYQNTVLKAQQEVENGIAVFLDSRDQVVFLQESVDGGPGRLENRVHPVPPGYRRLHHGSDRRAEPLSGAKQSGDCAGQCAAGTDCAYRAMGGGWQLREGHDFVPATDPRGDGAADQLGHAADARPAATQGARICRRPRIPGPLVRPPEW